MQSFNILLMEEGDRSSALRTRNQGTDRARRVLIEQGRSLVLQATLASVTHGEFKPDGSPASLLIFEFTFIGRQSHRFKSGSITLTFEDASGDVRNRPVVSKIAPSGNNVINKTVSKRDVSQEFNASLRGEFAGAGGETGYVWKASEVEETPHSTKMIGLKRVFADGGRENGVVWSLEEDSVKTGGIPSFLRAAVLLQRRDSVPFSFTIEVDSEVDFGGKVLRLFGFEKPDPVDPIELDEETDLEALGIVSLDPETPGLDLTRMGDMDVAKHSHVILASLINVDE